MSATVLCATALCLAVGISNTFAQDKIGINFAGRQWSIGGNAPETLAASDSAGVVPQQNWNNLDPASILLQSPSVTGPWTTNSS